MGWCLERIIIYPAVKTIHNGAFKRCDYLKTVKISGEIEKFMPCDAYGKWKCGQWDYHQGALRTDSFLVRCSIPQRLGSVQDSIWRDTIHEMLRRIPAVSPKPKKIP